MASGLPTLNLLLKRTTIDDHEEILRACNNTLKQSRNDVETKHIRIVALLKLDRYDDVLQALDEGGEELRKRAHLEHAYVLYKSGNLEQARALARQLDDGRGPRHVEAQASYRLEDFAQAANLYSDLSSTKQSSLGNEENDLRINGSATDAQLEWKRQGHLVQKKKARREDLDAFETAYNAACACIARGEFGPGEILLKRAKDLCIASDELSEDEKTAELLPISVQQLYVLGVLGKTEQAETLAAQIARNDIPDLSTRQLAQINQLNASTNPINPYLSHRIVHSTISLPKSDQLFDFQKTLTAQNEYALELLSSKFNGVASSTSKILSDHSMPTTSPNVNGISIANAAAKAQNQLGKMGLKSILPLLEKRPRDVGLVLTIVHLYILTNNHGSAITVLETFLRRLDESAHATDQDVRFAPGLVAVMISLYSVQGRQSHVRIELAKAASYWRHKSKAPASLLRAAGLSLLDSSNPDDLITAGEIFDGLHKEDPGDKLGIAGYVAAHATTNMSKVKSAVEKLTSINRLTVGIDVDALETAGVPLVPAKSNFNMSKKRVADGILKPAKKRIRKSRLPKDHDPSKTADPERWLPLRDRSTYRPKGKKGKQKQAALTQGGVNEKGAEALNIENTTVAAKPASTVVSAPSAKQQKKKGKKK